MKNITVAVLSMTLSLMLLTSCSKEDTKTAYCFSMVFERASDECTVTAYCRTADSEGNGDMKNITLSFKGEDFHKAVENADKGEYDIYFGSIRAYYTAPGINRDDINDIMLILFDNTRFGTANKTYNNDNAPAHKLHAEASEVCKNEDIQKTHRDKYSDTLVYFRRICGYK